MPRSAPGPSTRAAVEQHLARGRLVEAGDDAQQRGLAAARRAEDGDEVVVGDLEVGRLQRLRRRRCAERNVRDDAADVEDSAGSVALIDRAAPTGTAAGSPP